MNISNTSLPTYSSLYPDQSRQTINGMNIVSGNILLKDKNIQGLIKNVTGKISLDNCRLENPRSNSDLTEALLYLQNGNIKINNKSDIISSVELINGNIKIDDSDVKGKIKNTNGTVSLSKSYTGDIKVTNGVVELYSSTVPSIKMESGKINITDNSVVTGNVKANSNDFIINSSKILGNLKLAGNNLTLGCNSEINKLSLKHIEQTTVQSGSIVIKGKNVTISNAKNVTVGPEGITIDGVKAGSSKISKKTQDSATKKDIIQHITIEEGTILRDLKFTGKKCILTLQGSASYTGPKLENLEIIQTYKH